MQCKAHNRDGSRCKNKAIKGKEVCRMHGGKTPRGIANANYKHGRYSKDLPTRLAARYAEATNDPELLSLRSELALVDTRLAELISSVDEMATRDTMERLKRAYLKVIGGDLDITAIGSVIDEAMDQQNLWVEILFTIEQRRKLAESEQKRLVSMHQVITIERALILMGQLLESVKRNVTDRSQVEAIAADFSRIAAS